MGPNTDARRHGRILLGLLALGGLLDLGDLHAWQDSDSILPSLVSLEAWTPFFWRQDRYGMLMPFVFAGIEHPLYNQLAITWASLVGGLCAIMGTTQLLFGFTRVWPTLGLAALGVLLLGAPQHVVFDVMGPGQFFSTPWAMGLYALWLIKHDARVRMRLVALVLLGLSAWINCVTPVWLGLLWGAHHGITPVAASLRERVRHLTHEEASIWPSLVAALAFGFGLKAAAPVRDVVLTDVMGPYGMAQTCLRLASASLHCVAEAPALWALLAGCCVVAAWHVFGRRCCGFGRPAAAGLAAASAYMLLVASQRWVAQSRDHYRFWLPAALVLLIVIVGLAFGPWLIHATQRRQRVVSTALWCVVFAGAAVRFGVMSPAQVRGNYEHLGGAWAAEANALRCTHLAGGYWRVWPAVFSANIERFELGTQPQLLGLTDRAESTAVLWPDDLSTWRICMVPGDPVATAYTRGISHMQFRVIDRGALLEVLQPVPAP